MKRERNDLQAQDVRPSITALAVAMGFMRSLETGYEYLFSNQELKLIKHLFYTGKQSFPYGFNWALIEGISIMPYFLQQSFFNNVVFSGYDQVIMLRKLMVKNKVESAIQNDVRQIVFLGGGYDIRAFLTSLIHPEVNFYELDRGPTRKSKLEGLKSIPNDIGLQPFQMSEASDGTININQNLHYIECDLVEKDLLEMLHAHGFQQGTKTLVIAEGLTMYLDREENRKLLTSIKNLINEGDELLLSFMSAVQYSSVAQVAQNSSKELYRFSLPRQDVISFAQECGFDIKEQFIAQELLENIGDLSAAADLKQKPDQPKECYYLLKTSMIFNQNKTIEDVPTIKFPLSNKPQDLEKKSSACLVM